MNAGPISPTELYQMLQPTKLDAAISALFPKWGAKRVRARREYAYEAAVNTRLRSNAQRITGPEDYQAFPDRIALIKQMRDLEQNFGLFQGIIDKLAMYAFGRIRYQSRTGDKKRDDEYEEYLKQCFAACDLSGRNNFRQMVVLAFKAMLRDGDYALKWQRRPDGSLALAGIEGDRLGGIYMTSTSEDYFQGIIIDTNTGAPRLYRVYYRTKADAYINPVDIPAQDIIHVFDPRRYDQYRGITPFAPVINEARDLKELMEALRIGTKFENYHAAIQYTASGLPIDDPASFVSGSETYTNGSAITEQELKYGRIQVAPLGSKVEFLKSDRPAGTLQTYMEALIRVMGVALNMPYGFLYNLSGMAGPATRMDSAQAERVIGLSQENMKDRVMNRVKDTFLMEGFATGQIRFTPNWRNGVWQFPPWPTIDAGRDSNAAINEWRSGLKSRDSWFAEVGEDAEEQEAIIRNEAERTLAAAQEMAKKHDVPLEVTLTLLESKTPNGWLIKSSFVAPEYEPEPDKPAAAAPKTEEKEKDEEREEMARKPEPENPKLEPVRWEPLPSAQEAAQRIRSRLGAIHRIMASAETLAARKERLAKNADPLKWLEEETKQRSANVN